MTRASPATWRSLMFVPATGEKFVAKAHTRGADVVILDLEDSIPHAPPFPPRPPPSVRRGRRSRCASTVRSTSPCRISPRR